MYLNIEQKKKIFIENKVSEKNTGISEVQITIFTYRIKHLSECLRHNKKDYNTERSLVRLVGKRRKLLNYLKNKNIKRYRDIIIKLGLRK